MTEEFVMENNRVIYEQRKVPVGLQGWAYQERPDSPTGARSRWDSPVSVTWEPDRGFL